MKISVHWCSNCHIHTKRQMDEESTVKALTCQCAFKLVEVMTMKSFYS